MLEKVKETVAESLGADINTITEETSFKDDLGADSLDLFEMVMSLEESCGSGADEDCRRCCEISGRPSVKSVIEQRHRIPKKER